MQKLIKAYQGLDLQASLQALHNEVDKLNWDDPRYLIVRSGEDNAHDTFDGFGKEDLVKWFAEHAMVMPEYIEDAHKLAWATIATGSIQSNTCSPADFNAKPHHINWLRVRGFGG